MDLVLVPRMTVGGATAHIYAITARTPGRYSDHVPVGVHVELRSTPTSMPTSMPSQPVPRALGAQGTIVDISSDEEEKEAGEEVPGFNPCKRTSQLAGFNPGASQLGPAVAAGASSLLPPGLKPESGREPGSSTSPAVRTRAWSCAQCTLVHGSKLSELTSCTMCNALGSNGGAPTAKRTREDMIDVDADPVAYGCLPIAINADEVEAHAPRIIINLDDEEECSELRGDRSGELNHIVAIDLTADDITLARQLQRSLDVEMARTARASTLGGSGGDPIDLKAL